jgi:hypothetical protein
MQRGPFIPVWQADIPPPRITVATALSTPHDAQCWCGGPLRFRDCHLRCEHAVRVRQNDFLREKKDRDKKRMCIVETAGTYAVGRRLVHICSARRHSSGQSPSSNTFLN